MEGKEHANEVKGELNKFVGLSEEIHQVHKVLLGLLPDDAATKHDIWFHAKMLNVHDFIAGTMKWLAEIQGCTTAVVDYTEQTEEQVQGVTAVDSHGEKGETPAVGNKETEIKAAAHDQKDDVNKNGVEAQNKAAAGGHEEEEIQIEPHDSISNVASKSSRKSSRHKGYSTASSSSSSKSLAASERIRAEAQRAGLLARAAALKNKHALEAQEHLLKRQKEQLELNTEIAVASAKLVVLQASGSSRGSFASKHSDGMESYFNKGAKPKTNPAFLNPHALQFVPQPSQQHVSHHSLQGYAEPLSKNEVAFDPNTVHYSQQLDPTAYLVDTISKPLVSQISSPVVSSSQPPHFELPKNPAVTQSNPSVPGQNQSVGDLYSVLQQQNDITALLVQMQTSQLLPHREIPTSNDGDPLQFNSFMKAFEYCVEAKTKCKGDCLYYLEQYTRGQPRDIVRSCLHMTAERGYAVAKQLLKDHFGNEFNITAAYMEKVIGWPSIKSEDTKALKAYGVFLRECCNAMEELQYLEELSMSANMRILIQKSPYKLREKWRTKASEICENWSQSTFPRHCELH